MSAMAGHLGASLVAGYFLEKQRPTFAPEVQKGIAGDLDRVLVGEPVLGAKMAKAAKIADADLFAAFPKEQPNEALIDGIAEALAKNIQQLRESGHNVIFVAIAIHALKAPPEFATPAIVNGIRKLIRLFDKAHPGSGYYGKAKGRIHGNKNSVSLGQSGGLSRRHLLGPAPQRAARPVLHPRWLRRRRQHRAGPGDGSRWPGRTDLDLRRAGLLLAVRIQRATP